MLRLGHYAYYSLTTLDRMLARVGFTLRTAWTFDLYGGTVLLAATRGGSPDESVVRILDEERESGVGQPEYVGQLQESAHASARSLKAWTADQKSSRANGLRLRRRVTCYCAARDVGGRSHRTDGDR